MNQSDPKSSAAPRRRSSVLRKGISLLLCCVIAAGIMLTCTQCKKDIESQNAPTEAATAAPVEETTAPAIDPLSFVTPQITDDGTDGFISDVDPGVYVYHGMTFELCGASDEAGQDYAAAISEFKKAAPDVTVYNLVAPTHTEFGLPQRIIDNGVYSSNQQENIKTIYSSYTEDVKPINCYNALCENMNEYVYFNTDHHWTGLGAYYAYQAFCEQTGQTALELSACTEKTLDGFTGTFSSCSDSLNPDSVSYWMFPYQTHAMRMAEDGDELSEISIYYEGIEDSSSLYSTFICGDSALFIEYNDDNKNGKKIAVVKESYGNAFVPYLTNNYEEVHVIDFRYFGQNLKDYMEENGITEVLFLNNIMSANAAVQVDRIREII